jgi:hypothetical protein
LGYVRISRPIEDVFAYVSNPLNLPRWNSAVRAVRRTRGQEGGGGSTYRYRFSTANGEMLVHLDAVVELTGAAALLPPLAGRAIKRGVDDNFGELKRLLEVIAELGQRRNGPP